VCPHASWPSLLPAKVEGESLGLCESAMSLRVGAPGIVRRRHSSLRWRPTARIEAEIAIATLLRRLPKMQLDDIERRLAAGICLTQAEQAANQL
jgi:hypothetical protein